MSLAHSPRRNNLNKTKQPKTDKHQIGDVFQITEKHGRNGWIGAFVLATEIKSWGIQGFVSHIATHDEQQQAYIRLTWEEIEFIGRAPLTPSENRGIVHD